ncbi:MAG TPA: hypothetical protein VKX24_08110, partial [Acidimicrobiia bacterium]|nr:hypothetical protein [Acidimicrobiia bacterium]
MAAKNKPHHHSKRSGQSISVKAGNGGNGTGGNGGNGGNGGSAGPVACVVGPCGSVAGSGGAGGAGGPGTGGAGGDAINGGSNTNAPTNSDNGVNGDVTTAGLSQRINTQAGN